MIWQRGRVISGQWQQADVKADLSFDVAVYKSLNFHLPNEVY